MGESSTAPAAAAKRLRDNEGAFVARASSSPQELVLPLLEKLEAVAYQHQQLVKQQGRTKFKAQRKLANLVACQATGKLPKTLLSRLGHFKYHCPDQEIAQQQQALCQAALDSVGTTILQSLVEGHKQWLDKATLALATAQSAATTALQEAFNTFKAGMRHGSDDRRLNYTLRHVQVNMEAHITALLQRMEQSIVGQEQPPPEPAADQQGQQQQQPGDGAAAEDMEAEGGVGPLNQEGAAREADPPQVLATTTEIRAFIAAELAAQQQQQQQQRQRKPNRHPASSKQGNNQQQQGQQHKAVRFAVLRQPELQGYINQQQQPRRRGGNHQPQQQRQQRYGQTPQGRGGQRRQGANQQQQQQQQRAYNGNLGFQQGPPRRRRPSHNDGDRGGQHINGRGIPAGHNGGNASSFNGFAAGGRQRNQQQRRSYR